MVWPTAAKKKNIADGCGVCVSDSSEEDVSDCCKERHVLGTVRTACPITVRKIISGHCEDSISDRGAGKLYRCV